jgi:hypothetical protein
MVDTQTKASGACKTRPKVWSTMHHCLVSQIRTGRQRITSSVSHFRSESSALESRGGLKENIRNPTMVEAHMHVALTEWTMQSACSLTFFCSIFSVGCFPLLSCIPSREVSFPVWSIDTLIPKPSCYVDSSTTSVCLQSVCTEDCLLTTILVHRQLSVYT